MKIPFYRTDRLYARYKESFDKIAGDAFASGQYFNEAVITRFENKLAETCHRKYAVSTGSCTDALYFALYALGVERGDKVVVPAVSFIASVTPVLRAGAVPVFADIDPGTGLICTAHLEKLLRTHQVKAIMGVDLFGNLPDPAVIQNLASTYKVPYIEDAAQSLGSSRAGVVAGATGIISCLSFDPTKVIHAFGSGGALLTDDEAVAVRARQLRYHGRSGNDYQERGYNSRLNSMQAALLGVQLEKLAGIIADRNSTARRYTDAINEKGGMKCLQADGNFYNHHKFVVFSDRRDELKLFLENKSIQTMVHYPRPLYSYSLFRNSSYLAEGISSAEPFCSRVLTLPLHTFMDTDEVDYLCKTIQQIP
jgi:dTDP-4-amino-4,6-dideoxygalactose transaminase